MLPLNNGPEALQTHDNLLLIAGRDALLTVSVAMANEPRLIGEYRQRCPVAYDLAVVHGSFAYRTINFESGSGTHCQQQSQLETIDLSAPHDPRQVSSQNLQRPRGLAVLHGKLFVADETTGVMAYSLENPREPRYLNTWSLPQVKDLVISDFDLYALSPHEIQTFYIAPLYEADIQSEKVAGDIEGVTTIRQKRATDP